MPSTNGKANAQIGREGEGNKGGRRGRKKGSKLRWWWEGGGAVDIDWRKQGLLQVFAIQYSRTLSTYAWRPYNMVEGFLKAELVEGRGNVQMHIDARTANSCEQLTRYKT